MAPNHNYRHGALVLTDGHSNRVVEAIGQDVVKSFEDFIDTPIITDGIEGWTTTLVEAGAGESTLALHTTLTGGQLLFTTDSNENDGINLQKLGDVFRPDGNSFYFGCRFRISDATQSDFFIGLSVTDTAILTNLGKRIGFRKVDGSTGVSFEFKKTDTTTLGPIHTMVADTYVILEFYHNVDTGNLYVYVDGQEYGPVPIDNLPDAGLRRSVNFLTGEAVSKTMTLDWINVVQFGRSVPA